MANSAVLPTPMSMATITRMGNHYSPGSKLMMDGSKGMEVFDWMKADWMEDALVQTKSYRCRFLLCEV